MRIRKNIRIYFYAASIFLLLIPGGCGKNKGDSGTGPITGSDKVISFSMNSTPGDNSVFLEKLSGSNDRIVLAVKVKGGSNVYGVALEIKYDKSKISYISSSKGDYLGSEGEIDFYSGLYKGQEGILLIGASKRGTVVSGKSGDGTLGTITLKALTTQADTSIEFNTTNSRLTLPSTDISGATISGTDFIGGKLSYK